MFLIAKLMVDREIESFDFSCGEWKDRYGETAVETVSDDGWRKMTGGEG